MAGDDAACCLCFRFYDGYGNNPEPLAKWPHRCCDECNFSEVIPARLAAYLGVKDWPVPVKVERGDDE